MTTRLTDAEITDIIAGSPRNATLETIPTSDLERSLALEVRELRARVVELEGERSKREDAEASRWQERIAETIERAGLDPWDASGNDSGDPLDWTDDQVGHAIRDARIGVLRECQGAAQANHVRDVRATIEKLMEEYE